MHGIMIPGSTVALWSPEDPRPSFEHNQQLAVFGHILAKLAAGVPGSWFIRKAYIEFENVASPGDAVSLPTVDPMNTAHGTAYYSALSGSSVRDFLRVDLLGGPQFGVATDYEGYFPDGQGNKLILSGQSAGTVGFHGRTFTNGANSKIFGGALVVAPDEQDQTQDIVVARVYYASGDQKVKPASSQLTMSWNVPFILPE